MIKISQVASGLIVVVVMAGCSSAAKNKPIETKLSSTTATSSAPDWMLNQVHFDSAANLLFGYGSANSLAGAKNNAIADLSSFLLVQVSSSSRSQDIITRGASTQTSSNFQQTVITHSHPIILTGAEVAQSENLAGFYYIKIRVSATNLADMLLNQVAQTNRKLEDALLKVKTEPTLNDLVSLAQLHPSLIKSNTALLMLDALDGLKSGYFTSDFDMAALSSELDDLSSHSQQQFKKSFLILLIKNPALDDMAGNISQMIANSGVKSSTAYDPITLGKATGLIVVDGNIDEIDFQGAKIANIDLEVSLQNNQKITLAAKKYRLRGISPLSLSDAVNKAAAKWREDMGSNNLIADIVSN